MFLCYFKKIREFIEIDHLKPQPQWAYFGIGGETIDLHASCRLSKGRPGNDPRVEEGVYPVVFTTTICAKLPLSESKSGYSEYIFYKYCILKRTTRLV